MEPEEKETAYDVSGMESDSTEDADESVEDEIKYSETPEAEEEVAFTDMERVGCFEHLLQLVERKFDTVKEYEVVIKRFTAVVTKFNMSAILNAELIGLAG